MYSSSWESIPRRLQWVAPISAPNGHTEKAPWAQLGFHIWVGRASQQDIFISKVILDSDAHWAGLQEGDQVLAVKDVDFQNVEHSKATEILKTAGKASMHVCFFFFFFCTIIIIRNIGLCTRALQPTALHGIYHDRLDRPLHKHGKLYS